MASMASLINLGSMDMIFVHKLDSSVFLVRSVTFRSNYNNFKTIRKVNRESHVCVCVHKDSATTDYRGIRDTNNNNDAHQRIVRRPMLNSEPKGDPLVSMPWQETQPCRNSSNEKLSGGAEMSMVVDSLGKVLEKVEKNLGTGMKVSISENEPPLRRGDVQKNGKPVNSVKGPKRKVKTLKSVWQRGSSVATVKKVVKERTKQEIRTDEGKAAESQSVLPENDQSKLQENPFAKESVHLKSGNSADMSHDHNGTDLVNVRKPILMDKFASKKPVVDPLISPAVLPPPKQRKSFAPKKFKDKYRKKSNSSEGPRRRIIEKDEKITEEDTNELNVSIPGAGIARKGQKWTKARRRAVRRQAARDAMPVRVEIMEVGEDGMLTEDLAYNLAIGEGEILGYLYSKGIKPDGVQKLSNDMVKMVCKEYGVEVVDAIPTKVDEMAKKKKILEGDLDQLERRPPVLTIMGHVDHGKTTLLDYIRKSKVVAGEAGGITQGIGAYKVQVPFDGKTQTCVFLDTPGHEAFGAMRARGTRVTDIAVIVVAADDGIQPQTNEAFAHAKAAGVPIVVAINKIDKDGANPDRVMQDLSSVGLMPEDWGGDVPVVKISALKGKNVDELLETVMLVAELQELKANPHRHAKGTVIEAGLDKAKGPVTTFIVQNGTLRKGEVIACGEAFGKVRALFDDSGKHVDEAGPSIPVQVLGLNNVPLAGDEFEVVDGLAIAREKAEPRAEYLRNKHITEKAGDGKVTLASFASAVSSGKNSGLDLHELSIILKVDVQGSIEAIRQALQVLPHDNVTLKFLLQATGDVSKSDIDLAVASKAIIFGFNVKVSGSVKSYSDNKKVEIRLYKVIYELIDGVRNTMEGLLDLVEERVQIGSAEVRAIFSSGSSCVAGCMVMEGMLVRECGIRVIRKGKEVHVGILNSLKRIKEMVKEVNAGLECGVGVEGFSDWEAGDVIETFNTVLKRRTLEEASATMSAALKQVGIQL